MNHLLHLLHAPNRWFDALPELRRFGVLLMVGGPLAVAGMASEEVDMVAMGLLGVIALYRWHYLHISQSL